MKKDIIYNKRIKWALVANMLLFVLFMVFCLLFSSNSILATIIDSSLIVLFLIVMLLYFCGVSFYKLILSDEGILEKKFLKKKTFFDWKELKKIQISLDDNAIYLIGENMNLTLRSLKHADKLLVYLREKLGDDKIEFCLKK